MMVSFTTHRKKLKSALVMPGAVPLTLNTSSTSSNRMNGRLPITIDGVDTAVYTEPSDVIHGTVASDSDVTAMLTEVFGA